MNLIPSSIFPQTLQPITSDRLVCPPWIHPLLCVTDPSKLVKESIASDPKNMKIDWSSPFVWLLVLPLPLLMLWDKLKNQGEIKLRKKNPVIQKGRKISEYTTLADITKENVYIGKLPHNPKSFVSWEAETYQANLFETPEDVIDKNQKVFMPRDAMKGRVLPFGMRPPFMMFFKGAPKALLAAAQYILRDGQAEIIFMSTRPGWKNQGLMSAVIDAIKAEHGISKVTYWEPTKAGKAFAKKKNPINCSYEATIAFKRGGAIQKKHFSTAARNMADAKNKFHDIIDRDFKNVPIESLHVERVLC